MDAFDSFKQADEWARQIDTDAPRRVRIAIKLALKSAEDTGAQKSPGLKQASKEAEALLRRMGMPNMGQRVEIAAHLAGITPEQFRAAVHYLAWASESLNPPRQDGTQGRTPFTRFVRALDTNMGIMGLPEMPTVIVDALFSKTPLAKPNKPRMSRDVELLRARPYVDEAGSEIGEIIPEPK